MLKFVRSMKNQKSIAVFFTSILFFFYFSNVYADGSTLGTMATTMREQLAKFASLIGTGSYVVGLGFSIGAIMKFKQHKDNPSNIPIGTPVALLFVAVALVFLPSVIHMTGSTMSLKNTAGESGVFDLTQ